MAKFEIWAEGYRATGECGTATYFGTIEADSFQQACDMFFGSAAKYASYYDSKKLTYWACNLFDNEKAARKSFG